MFSPSSYRTPKKPISPGRFTIWNTPSPARGFKTPAASPFMSTGKRRKTSSIIARNPALRGFAQTSGVYGRFQPSGVESKFFDLNLTHNNINSGTAGFGWESLNQIPQGDGPSARIGRSVTVTSVQFMYHLDIDKNETNAIYLRCMLVLDKQCNGTAATPTMLMNANHILSYRNLDNADRFVVLYDKTQRASPSTVSGAGVHYQGANLKFVYKKCNIPITFDQSATTGGISTIRSNNLFIIMWLNGHQTNDNDVKMTCRVRYRED